ncbi:hypothetical protein CR513_35723, partial [Mucuna pruriens]
MMLTKLIYPKSTQASNLGSNSLQEGEDDAYMGDYIQDGENEVATLALEDPMTRGLKIMQEEMHQKLVMLKGQEVMIVDPSIHHEWICFGIKINVQEIDLWLLEEIESPRAPLLLQVEIPKRESLLSIEDTCAPQHHVGDLGRIQGVLCGMDEANPNSCVVLSKLLVGSTEEN